MLRIQQLHKAVALSLVESEKIDAKGASLIVPERMRSNSQKFKPCQTNLSHN